MADEMVGGCDDRLMSIGAFSDGTSGMILLAGLNVHN